MRPIVLIVGIGDTGAHLCKRLGDSFDVIALDEEEESLEREELSDCLTRHRGDGTSALVLRKAGADKARTVVATTRSDEKNLEVLRLAKQELKIEDLHVAMHDGAYEERYKALGVEIVDWHQSCAALLESRIEVRTVATNIGLGEGEIMEVEVLANSSVIGHRLADLSPQRWLVGAVYRDGELIVPHGDTVLQEGDRVLIVGEPEILSSIATHIGAGESEFPLHYGTKIVVLDRPELEVVVEEASYLLQNTAASHLELISTSPNPPEKMVSDCDEHGYSLKMFYAPDATPMALANKAAQRDVGVLVLEPERLSLWQRIGLGRSAIVRFIDLLSSPALIARGSMPYERVVLVLAELPFSMAATQLAIDLVRMIGSSLHLAVVHQPDLVVGSQLREEIDDQRRQVQEMANLYHVEIQVDELSGNPIREVIRHCEDFDLCVLPYRRERRSSLTRPDVGQNLIHNVRCSTLVMPC